MIFAGTTIKNTCPNDEVFINAFMQELSLKENERLIDHTLVCKKCHLKFGLLRQLSEELAKRKGGIEEGKLTIEEEKELRELAKKKFKKLKGTKLLFFNIIPAKYVVAAAALLVVVAGLIFVSKIKQREIYREGDRKEEIRLIEPAGVVKKVPIIFSWTAYESADDYLFELIDSDLNTVHEASVLESQLTLPPAVRQKLKKGITYVWKVEARDEFGNVLSSDFTSFELK